MAERSYSKLKDGSWGIRSTTPLSDGQKTIVTKRDGTSKQETVGHVLWHGNGVWLASIGESRKTNGAGEGNPGRFIRTGPVETRRCWECGGLFTYADAKRNDGDWNDSYCGC